MHGLRAILCCSTVGLCVCFLSAMVRGLEVPVGERPV